MWQSFVREIIPLLLGNFWMTGSDTLKIFPDFGDLKSFWTATYFMAVFCEGMLAKCCFISFANHFALFNIPFIKFNLCSLLDKNTKSMCN